MCFACMLKPVHPLLTQNTKRIKGLCTPQLCRERYMGIFTWAANAAHHTTKDVGRATRRSIAQDVRSIAHSTYVICDQGRRRRRQALGTRLTSRRLSPVVAPSRSIRPPLSAMPRPRCAPTPDQRWVGGRKSWWSPRRELPFPVVSSSRRRSSTLSRCPDPRSCS